MVSFWRVRSPAIASGYRLRNAMGARRNSHLNECPIDPSAS